MGFFAGWRRIHGFPCSFPFPLMLILSRNFRVHSSRETAQIERTELPQAPTNLERFRCRFSKSGNIRKHCTITHRFYNLPGRRIQAATVWRVSHKYPPVFAAFSLTNTHRLFVRESEKTLWEKGFCVVFHTASGCGIRTGILKEICPFSL